MRYLLLFTLSITISVSACTQADHDKNPMDAQLKILRPIKNGTFLEIANKRSLRPDDILFLAKKDKQLFSTAEINEKKSIGDAVISYAMCSVNNFLLKTSKEFNQSSYLSVANLIPPIDPGTPNVIFCNFRFVLSRKNSNTIYSLNNATIDLTEYKKRIFFIQNDRGPGPHGKEM